jgi:ubiquinone/menaquinone biosynthesis C-methylase UbiE
MAIDPGTRRNDPVLEAIRAAWEAGAATYDQQAGHGLSDGERRTWRRVLGQALQPLASTTAVRVLDIGTGTGEMALLLAAMGLRVSALDLSPAMLEVARRKAVQQGAQVSWVEAAADALPFADQSFDVVFSRHLFWTLPDPLGAVREWARVVRPGGLVLIADGWWNEPSQPAQLRRAIGRVLRALFEGEAEEQHRYATVQTQLPVVNGVSPYSIRYYLDSANLTRIRVRDLRSVRQAERRARPIWQWIDMARYTWLASAFKPEP